MSKQILAVLVVLASLTSFAQEAQQSEVDKCLDQATSNMAMKQCVYEEYDRQDKVLNIEYAKLTGNIKKDTSDEGKEILKRVIKNQRAWITMRDTTCSVEGIDMLGGTGEGLIVGGCLGRMTKERIPQIIEMQKNLSNNR